MTPLEFYRARIGPNWVVARRTPNILSRYGADVICVSQARLRQVDKEYRALYGDPYDKVRAELYLCLKEIRDGWMQTCPQSVRARADAALEAERNAR